MSKTKTNDEFLREFIECGNEKVEILSDYVNAKTKILVRCKKCGLEWNVDPRSILRGSGCNKCKNKPKPPVKKKKSQDQFLKEVCELHPNIEVLGEYNGTINRILVRCKIDGHEWSPFANNLLNKSKPHGCPKCAFRRNAKSRTITHKEFIKSFLECNNDSVEIKGVYSGADKKIDCKCLICGELFQTTPYRLLNGVKHYSCAQKIRQLERRKTHDEFINEMRLLHPNIEVLGTYITAKDNINVKCLKCGEIWCPVPDSLHRGSGCPQCNISLGENRITNYLTQNNLKFKSQKTFKDLLGVGNWYLKYDFYVPNYNLLIEYQGQFHDGSVPEEIQSRKDLEQQQEHDKRKREYAKLHNIGLLEIWYWDYGNIETILNEKLKIVRELDESE